MVTAPELYLAWSLPRTYGATSHLARIAMGGILDAIGHAAQTDNDVIDGDVDLVTGAQAATVIARVILREGSHPDKSLGFVLNGLVENWLPGAPPDMERIWFEQVVASAATLMLFESENIARRGLERADFSHFTGDLAFYGHRLDALGSLGPGQLQDFFARYLNRDRARSVLVRPIPRDREASGGHVGLAEAKDSAAPMKFDVASVQKLAVAPGMMKSFHVRTLPNGLVVEAARHGTAPIVTIGLGIRAGMTEEAESGVASMAWMLATPGRSLHGHFRDHGAFLDRSHTTDGVTFRVRGTSSHVDTLLAILADNVTSLEVRSGQYDAFDKYGLDYTRREQERPEYVGNRDFRRSLFGSHVFGHSSEIPADRRPSRGATNQWLAANITPARATLAIVGDVDPEEALRWAESAFGGWSGAPGAPDPEPLGTGGSRAEVVTHRPGATQAMVRLGCRLPKLDWSDAARAEVVSVALSQRIGSVRENKGLSYGLGAELETLRGGTGVILVGGAVENAGLSLTLRTIRNEITRLATLKGAELDRGRWRVATRYNIELTTTSEWVMRALEAGRNGWSLESIDKVPDVLASLNANNVLSALRSCPNDGTLSIVGDETAARRSIKEAWLPTPSERRGGSVTR
jgi:zinc protease